MKKNKILAIIISGVMIVTVSGAIGQTRKDSKENIILKKVNNTLLINNNTNYSVNACVVNGNGRLVLTNKNGEIASYLSVGEMLKIQSVEGNKSLVTVEETGAKGYINNSNKIDINKGDINNITRMNKDGYIINVSNVVNLRKGPSMNYTVLEALSNSTHVKITGKTDQWYKVDVNGEKGYIFEEYVGEKNISQSNHSLKDIYTVSKVNSVALPHSNNLSDIHITPNIKSIASDGSKIVSSASKAKGDVHIIPVNKAVESTTDSSDNTSGHKIKPIVSDGSKIVSSASKAKGDAHTMPVNKVGKSTTDSSDNTSGHKIKPIVSGGSKIISSNSKTKGDAHTIPVNKSGSSKKDSSGDTSGHQIINPDKSIKHTVVPKKENNKKISKVIPQINKLPNVKLQKWETGFSTIENKMNACNSNGRFLMDIYTPQNTAGENGETISVRFANTDEICTGKLISLITPEGGTNSEYGYLYKIPLYYKNIYKGTLYYGTNIYGYIQTGGFIPVNEKTPVSLTFNSGYWAPLM